MSRFHLRTLGRISLVDDSGREDPTLVTRPRKLALLVWLALRPGRRATRHRMVGVFWGERDEPRARNSLSDAVSHLRRTLGREAIQSQGSEVVIAEGAPLNVDALELGVAAAARDHARVVELYAGPFLDGFYVENAPEFDDWRDRERARLAGLFARSAAVRCAALVEARSWDDCRALAERWLDAEPASADAALALLRAVKAPETHAAYAAVMSTFEALVRRLDHEAGIAPDRTVTAFANEVAAQLAATPAPVTPTPVVPVPGTVAVTPPARRPRLPRRITSVLAAMAVVLVLAAVGVAAMRDSFTTLDGKRVVVATFLNRTGDSTLAQVGAVAADWVSRGLTETRMVDVLEPIVRPTTLSGIADARVMGREAGAGLVVIGSYVRQGDSLTFDARLVDANTGRVLRAVPPAMSHASEPLIAVNLVRQRVAGSVAAELDRVITGVAREASQPPTFEAYLAWVEGLDKFQHRAYRAAVPVMLRAAALDSNFVSPRIWAAAALGNAGDYARCDSILRSVMPMRDRFGPLDRGLADMWAAVLRGDMPGQYLAGKEMMAAAPNSELALYTAGIKAIEVNRPHEAIGLLRRIPVERSGVLWDIYGTRLSTALHWARRHDEELVETKRRLRHQPTSLRAMEEHARALIAVGRLRDADRVLGEMFALPGDTSRSVGAAVYSVAQELIAHGHPSQARSVFRRISEWARSQAAARQNASAEHSLWVRSLHGAGELTTADSLVRALLEERPRDWSFLAVRGIIAAQQGDVHEAERVSAALGSLETQYLQGRPALSRARIAAVLGRKEDAVRFVRQARSEGASINDLHLYPEMHLLRGYEPFEELLRAVG